MNTLARKCGRVLLLDSEKVCNRPESHYGLHRTKVSKTHQSTVWGDSECVTGVVMRFTVKIWYWSGAYEEIPGVDHENALAYMAEAQHNNRVEAAEMHDVHGTLSGGFRHTERPELAPVDNAG